MSKFVSFYASGTDGSSFMGNVILSNFDIQTNGDLKRQEDIIKNMYNCKTKEKGEVSSITIINWRSL